MPCLLAFEPKSFVWLRELYDQPPPGKLAKQYKAIPDNMVLNMLDFDAMALQRNTIVHDTWWFPTLLSHMWNE